MTLLDFSCRKVEWLLHIRTELPQMKALKVWRVEQEMGVVSKWVRSWMQVSFKGCLSSPWEMGWGVRPFRRIRLLLLHIESSHLRWFRYLRMMPLWCLLGEMLQACRTRKDDTLERFCLLAGLGTPRVPVEGHGWIDVYLVRCYIGQLANHLGLRLPPPLMRSGEMWLSNLWPPRHWEFIVAYILQRVDILKSNWLLWVKIILSFSNDPVE